MNFAVVILAGGEGARIGGGKPLRMLAGTTLFDRAIAQARQWSDLVAVAVRDETQIGEAQVESIKDERGVEGPLAGVIAGFRFAAAQKRDALLTIPTDMPFLPPDLAKRLQASATGRGGAAIASSGGFRHPVCALWPVDALKAALAYAGTGRRSLKGLAETVGFAAVEWPSVPFDPFFNINTDADLIAAEQDLR